MTIGKIIYQGSKLRKTVAKPQSKINLLHQHFENEAYKFLRQDQNVG